MTELSATTPALDAQPLGKMSEESEFIAVDASSTAQTAADVNAELQEAAGAAAQKPVDNSTDLQLQPSQLDGPSNTTVAAEDTATPADPSNTTVAAEDTATPADPSNTTVAAEGTTSPADPSNLTVAAEDTTSPADPSNTTVAAEDTTSPAQETAPTGTATEALDITAAQPEASEPSAAPPGTGTAQSAPDSSVNSPSSPVDEQEDVPDRLQQEEQAAADAAAVTSPGSVTAAKAAFLNSHEPAQKVLSPQRSGAYGHSNGLAADASLTSEDEKPVIKVRELRAQLSATHIPLTGGSRRQSTDGKEEEKRGPSLSLSEHDKVNTANVAELLKTVEYKLVPGVDVVPYQELIKLRLEDGVDVTRKEEYLSNTDFITVMGMDKAAFAKLPQWKKLQVKKAKLLF